jgi:lysozyme
MLSRTTQSVQDQDPSLAFLNRLIDRITDDEHYAQLLAECVSRGAGDRFFALIDDPDDRQDLDDGWLDECAGGRGSVPLALALLAGAFGSGHALPSMDPAALGGAGPFVAWPRAQAHGLQPGWQDHALPLIRTFEGLSLEAYLDPVGIATIGYGTIRYADGQPVQLGDRISREQAERLLADAVADRYAPALLAAIPPARSYSAEQQAALISFTYNVGVGALQRSSLRRRLLAGEDPQQVIAAELPRWSRGDGRELPGLVRRRAAEVDLFLRGRYG